MPSCRDCGFEIPDSGTCPICAASRRRPSISAASPLARLAAALRDAVLPALLAIALIAAATGIYLTDRFDSETATPTRLRRCLSPRLIGFRPLHRLRPTGARPARRPNLRPGSAKICRRSPRRPTSSGCSHTATKAAHVLEKKWDRAQILIIEQGHHLAMAPSEPSSTRRASISRGDYNIKKAYDNTAIPIGYGQTISGPHMVCAHDPTPSSPRASDRILEIGTGSGYQSAVLSELSDHVYTIEIVDAALQGDGRDLRQARGRLSGIQEHTADRTPTATSAGRNTLPSRKSS